MVNTAANPHKIIDKPVLLLLGTGYNFGMGWLIFYCTFHFPLMVIPGPGFLVSYI